MNMTITAFSRRAASIAKGSLQIRSLSLSPTGYNDNRTTKNSNNSSVSKPATIPIQIDAERARATQTTIHTQPHAVVKQTETETATAIEKYAGIDRSLFIGLIENAGPYVRKLYKPKVEKLNGKKLELLVPYNPFHVGNFAVPCLHSGALASMIDHVGLFCAWSSLNDPFLRVRTADIRVDHLSAAPLEDLRYSATLIHKSKHLIRTDVTVWDKNYKRKFAIGRAAFHIIQSNANLHESLNNASDRNKNKAAYSRPEKTA